MERSALFWSNLLVSLQQRFNVSVSVFNLKLNLNSVVKTVKMIYFTLF